jgi:hypothetical protein
LRAVERIARMDADDYEMFSFPAFDIAHYVPGFDASRKAPGPA